MKDLTGQEIDGYLLEAQLAEHPNTAVYRARKLSNDKPVVFKIMIANTKDPQFFGRFMREMGMLEELEHPNIAAVLGWGVDSDERPYLIREYIDGETLRQVINENRQTPHDVQLILQSITSALDYIHKMDIIHRDVTPDNMFVSADGQVHLTDFAFVKQVGVDTSFTGSNIVVGTPEYASPEAVNQHPLDSRADLYSLTVMCYEMLLGRLPFFNERSKIMVSLGHAKEPPPKPSSINPAFPMPLEIFLLKGLEKDPSDRYQAAGLMMEAYNAAFAQLSDEQRNTVY